VRERAKPLRKNAAGHVIGHRHNTTDRDYERNLVAAAQQSSPTQNRCLDASEIAFVGDEEFFPVTSFRDDRRFIRPTRKTPRVTTGC
jgi:hypothetical protein